MSQLASVASKGEVKRADLDVSSFGGLGEIDLDGTVLDASDKSGGGTVLLRGGLLSMVNGSLIEDTTAARKHDDVDSSFEAPGFLDHFNDHLYNPREDTMISSQYVVRFPSGGEHQYVVEKR